MRHEVYPEGLPTISCLMLTYDRTHDADIPWFNKTFVQSFGSFIGQRYPKDKLELVVVCSGSEEHLHMVTRWVDPKLTGIKYTYKIIEADSQKSLGELRNIGLAACTGDFVATWDDDDVSDSVRLMSQVQYCFKHSVDATMLQNFNVVINDGLPQPAYLPFGLDATLLFVNPRGDVWYPDMDAGEDSNYIDRLCDAGYKVCAYSELDPLYTYNYHGANTMSLEHIKSMILK